MNIKLINISQDKKSSYEKDKQENNNLGLKKISQKLGRTFLSKLIMKLTSKLFIPSFHLQILRFETFNRSNDDIIKAMPWFKTQGNFDAYINLEESNRKINNLQIIYDLASQSFYKYKKANSIIKKANDNKHIFYLIINGNITRLNLLFIKKKLSIENYLVYLIKMQLLQEDQIIQKCKELNKKIIDIDINDFDIYTKNDIIYDLKEIQKKSRDELINEGFYFFDKRKILIPSINSYINLSEINMLQNRDVYSGYELYIGCYSENGKMKKGDFIGDLSINENSEYSTYICESDCDIITLDKKHTQNLKFKLYDYMQSKIKNIFMKLKPKFLIFKDISDDFCINEILPLLEYKIYKKGEKIFSQFSIYEGIFLIIKGQIKLSLSQTYNELSNTLSNLTYANSHFKEYAFKSLNNLDYINEFHLSHIINKKKSIKINSEQNELLSSNKYNESFKGINIISFYNINFGELGFNELFDTKDGLYNFNAECISDDANLFFISKKNFENICEKKPEILNSVIQLVEYRAKSLIGKINKYKNQFKHSVINSFKFQKRFNDINKSNSVKNISCINIRKNLNFISENNKNIKKDNNGLFKNNNLLQYFKNSKFFDYSIIANQTSKNNSIFKNKIKFKNLFENEKNNIILGRTFQGLNKKYFYFNQKINKKAETIEQDDLNMNLNYTLDDINKRFLGNNNIKSEIKGCEDINKNIKIRRISSLPLLNIKIRKN